VKKNLVVFLSLTLLWAAVSAQTPNASVINAAYVNALYAKYPVTKSDFCSDCYLWINPYYASIGDIKRHMPLVTYEHFTKVHNDQVAPLKIPRKGIYAAWHSVTGQPNEDNVYAAANVQARQSDPKAVIAKGHCEAWILNAFCDDAAILSDTYTFNAALENQKQNVGTEIATENITREKLKTMDVDVWCGTYGAQGTFTDGKITDTYPAFYWKIIKAGGDTTCYWMPNIATATKATLPQCVVNYAQLVANLGFDPQKVFPTKP